MRPFSYVFCIHCERQVINGLVSSVEQMLTRHLGYARPDEPDMTETWCIHRQWKWTVGSTMVRDEQKTKQKIYKATVTSSQMTWRWCIKLWNYGWWPSSVWWFATGFGFRMPILHCISVSNPTIHLLYKSKMYKAIDLQVRTTDLD